MEKSQSLKEIATALMKFHKHIGKISKDSTNPFFKNKYCSLPNILDAIKEPLQEAGLCFSQHPQGKDELETLLIHAESGEFMQSSYNITPVKNDPQSLGSAITYARRYALGAILGLTIDEDDDANAATTPKKQPEKQPAQPQKKTATDPAINKAVERILTGELDLITKLKDTFILTENQLKVLEIAKENYSKSNKAA